MIQKFGAFDEMFDLFRELDRFLGRPAWQARQLPADLTGRYLPVAQKWAEFCPAMECFTRDKQFVVKAELPGVDPKDVEVSIEGNRLFLRGEKKQDREIDEKDIYFQEFSRGKFQRSLALPEGVKADQVKASFHNGVLELSMPSGMADQARKVPIDVLDGGKKVKAA